MLLAFALTVAVELPAQYAWTEPAGKPVGIASHPAHGIVTCEHAVTRGIRSEDVPASHLPFSATAADIADDGTMVLLNGLGAQVHVLNADCSERITFGEQGDRLRQFDRPQDVATNGKRIAVADTGNRRVLLFDMDGGNMGLYDSIEGTPLLLPTSVAMADDGTLFIGDEGTHQVHALTPDGAHRWTTGGWGRAPGRFAEPSGLDEQRGVVLVADRLNHRIQGLDAADGALIDWWGMHAVKPRAGEGRIHYPEDVAFTEKGCVVAEPFEHRLQGFEPGPPSRPRALRGPDGPQSHFGERMGLLGRVLVLFEPEQRRFHVLDIDRPTPVHLTSFGDHTVGPSCVQRPVSIDLRETAAGLECEVTDAADGRRHVWRIDLPDAHRPRFSPDAAKLLRAGAPVDGPVPHLPLNRSDTLPDGTLVELRGLDQLHIGNGPSVTGDRPDSTHGRLWNPTEVRVDHNGRILVLDHGNHRMQAFDDQGRWLMSFGTGRAWTPQNTPAEQVPTR